MGALSSVTSACPCPLEGPFRDARRKQTALLPVTFHCFSLQLSLHFRAHVSARDSILGFVGTGLCRQIGSSRNLSKLVPLGLPADSEGSRDSVWLPWGPETPMCADWRPGARAAAGQPAASRPKPGCCPGLRGPRGAADAELGVWENRPRIPTTPPAPSHQKTSGRWWHEGAQP